MKARSRSRQTSDEQTPPDFEGLRCPNSGEFGYVVLQHNPRKVRRTLLSACPQVPRRRVEGGQECPPYALDSFTPCR